MSTYVNSEIQMHAHKCQACEKSGKEVIWIHPDICRGKVAAHKCPECGTINWKQCRVESAKLPQVQRGAQNGVSLEVVLGYIMLAIGLALVGYGAFLYVKKRRNAALLNEGCEK